MTLVLSILFVVGLPLLAMVGAYLAIRAKRRHIQMWIEQLLAPFERLPHGCFRHHGRVFRFLTDVNPLLSRTFSLRLSTFTNTALEFEVRAARNVPTKTPQRLAMDPFYRHFVLDTPAPDEAVEHLLAVKETLAHVFPRRWRAFGKVHCEVVLSANTAVHDDFKEDLEALIALAAVPGERRPRGGTWTLRSGFEKDLPPWHWKPAQRARLPEGCRRWCISAWYDNAYLNAALARFLWRLGEVRVVTLEHDLWFLEHAFARSLPVRDNLVQLSPEMALAGDQWLDGELFQGAVAGAKPDAFADAIKFSLLDVALSSLSSGARFYARRLFDDEFSWFSGEYEIVSTSLTDEEVRTAFQETADEFKAEVREIDRPFSFKLLKEDRLDISF